MPRAQEELVRCTEFLERFNKLRTIPDWITEVENALDELLDMEYSGLYLYNEATERLELLVAKGFTEDERLAAESTAMERHPGKVFQTGEGWYIPDVLNDPTYATTDSDRSFQVRSRLYHPIRVNGKIVGVFGAVSSKVNAFSPMERESFRFLIHLSATIYLRIRTEQANEELHAIKDRLSFIATHTDNMVILTDAQERIEWVNDAFVRVTGYSCNEVIGQNPGELLQRADSDHQARRQMKQAIQDGKPCLERIVNYRKDGAPYHAEIQIYPIRDDQGKITNYISLQRDISDAVQAREEIETSRNRLSAIVSALPDELVLLQRKGETNELELTPLTPVREQMLELLMQSAELGNLGVQFDTKAGLEGREDQEIIMQCPATQCFFEARHSMIDRTKSVILIRDVTSRKQLEAERDARMDDLECALKELESRNMRLHNFSNVLSHNIRSHTSNVMGLVKLIRMDPDSTKYYFEVLDRVVHNLDETIRSLNSTISISMDPKVDKEYVDIKLLVNKIVESLAVDIHEAQARVLCDFEGLPVLWADKSLLESIVMNLITNATKYRSKDRKPVIEISTIDSGSAYELRVKDNGVGIDLKRHGDEIFGMFKTFNKERKGQGIGLHLTRNQVEMMGGSITVDSEPGMGSTFTVYLPVNEQ